MVFVSDFPGALVSGNFSNAPAEILYSNILFNNPQNPCLFNTLFEYNPTTHGLGTMLVLPNQRLSFVFSHVGPNVLLPSNQFFYRPHTLIRIVLFLG